MSSRQLSLWRPPPIILLRHPSTMSPCRRRQQPHHPAPPPPAPNQSPNDSPVPNASNWACRPCTTAPKNALRRITRSTSRSMFWPSRWGRLVVVRELGFGFVLFVMISYRLKLGDQFSAAVRYTLVMVVIVIRFLTSCLRLS